MAAKTRCERGWMWVALLACGVPIVMQDANAVGAERSGKEVVAARCVQCHESGVNGAPRIGDKQAWTPRLKQGIDFAVYSAIKGHGDMPARGGMPDLTDREVRNAILHMFNPAPAPVAEAPATKSAKADANHASAGGMEIFFGLVSAKSLRAFPKDSVERTMHGGVPAGDGYYHANVSVVASADNAPVTDAKVGLRIEQPGLSSESKNLEPMSIGSSSYGGYFKMSRHAPYRFTVRVHRPGSQPTEVAFERRLD